jgi:hypothetical protein
MGFASSIHTIRGMASKNAVGFRRVELVASTRDQERYRPARLKA